MNCQAERVGNASQVAPSWFAPFPASFYWAISSVENLSLCVLAFARIFFSCYSPLAFLLLDDASRMLIFYLLGPQVEREMGELRICTCQ